MARTRRGIAAAGTFVTGLSALLAGCASGPQPDALGRAFGRATVASTGNEAFVTRAPVPQRAGRLTAYAGPSSPGGGALNSPPPGGGGQMPNVVVRPPGAGGAVPGGREGSDREHPVVRCGPRESYRYVAAEFRCGNGSNPLNGNLGAGAGARVRNVGANASGHIIDLYVVQCPEGPQEIYVDMYGCSEPGGAPGAPPGTGSGGGVRTL